MERTLADDVPLDREPHHRWLIPVWVVVAMFAAVTGIWSAHVGIPLRDPHGAWFRNRLATSLAIFAVLALVDAAVRTARPGWSFRRALGVLRRRWPLRRLALALSALLAYFVVYVCYRNLKSWDVFNTIQDDFLLRLDRWLFFGHDPASLLHDLLGQGFANYALVTIYQSFSYLVTVAVVAAVVFVDRIRDGYVAIASGLWIWILGTGSYYLIPSLGPFNEAPDVFAGLPHGIVQETQAKYMGQRAYLLEHPEASDAVAQISAFASLHVGVTCVILLMARYYGLRRVTWFMSAYLVGTVLATVYLGWHYAVDDIAGILIALLAVWFGRLMIYPRGRPSAPDPAPDREPASP